MELQVTTIQTLKSKLKKNTHLKIKTYLSGNMRRPLSIPGVYDRKAASAVSKIKPKLSAQLRIPWWTIELRRVLQIIKSAHCTTTMDTKKAVWHVYSNVFLSRYV